MSDMFDWVSPVSGDWTTTGNWSLPGFPDGATDAAVIGATGNGYTVTLGGGGTLITVATLAITYSSASLNIAAADGTESVLGTLNNAGVVNLDNEYYGVGGSTLTVGGTLTNSGQVNVGDTSIGTSSTLIAAALLNTGGLYVAGNTSAASPTATANVLIGGAAGFGTLGVLTGQVNMDGFGRIAFAGGGQIGTIAAGAQLQLFDHSAIADATDTTNSALQGLVLDAGELRIDLTTLTVTGGLTNTGRIDQDDAYYDAGGALLAIAGTLVNSGQAYIGQFSLGSNTTLTAAGLVNTGYLQVEGDNTTGTNVADVLIGGAAGFGTASVLTGNVYVDGHGTIAFAGGGQITTIAAGAILDIRDQSAIADGTDSTNTALTGLAENDGQLIVDFDTITTTGSLNNTGRLDLDDSYYNAGGGLIAIAGTLVNSGQAYIGQFSLGSNTTLTAAGLVNTGYLQVEGDNTTGTSVADLLIGGGAGFGTAGVLTGNVYVDGHGTIAFAGGDQIATIASGAVLDLRDKSAIADGTDATNTALQGLTENDGNLIVAYETLTLTGGLTNTDQINLDNAYYAAGGGLIAIAGTLVNTGQVSIGELNLSSATTLTAAALVNTGNVSVQGNNATGSTNAADLLIGGAAGFGTVGVLTGNVYMDGHGTIAFAGGGQITTIAAGAALQMRDLSTIADGTDTTSTALQGLSENDGDLTIAYDTLTLTGGLTNTDQINLDNAYYGAGGGLIAIGGTLVNTAQINVGDNNITSNTTLTAGGLVNTGNLQITGNGSLAAVLAVGGTAINESVVGVNAAATVTATGTYTQQADNTQVYGTLAAATVAVTGGVLDGGGMITGALINLGGGTVLGGTAGSPGTLSVTGSYTQAGTGVLDETFNGSAASQLAVSGAVALGGTLDLSLLNGATLAAGDDIVVLTAGAFSGTFATINDGGLSAGGTSSIAIGNGLYLNPVYDDAAGVMRLVVSATEATPPQINAPTTLVLTAGTMLPITTISVSAQAPGTISVQLSDSSGLLAATAAAGAMVSGDDSTALTLAGSVSAVNEELASLTDTPQGSAATDRLTVTVTDSTLQVASGTVDVTIDQPPAITAPASVLAAPGQPDPLVGISVADPGAVAAGLTLTAVLSDSAGLLAATGAVSGNDSTQITLAGTLADLNAELATLTFSGSTDDTLAISVSDGQGGSAAGTLAINVSPPPTISVPTATQPEFNAITQTISGIAVSAPAGTPSGRVFSLTVSAQSGLLTASASGGATVSGNGTSQLTVTGTATALNTTLSALSYTGPSSGTADTIIIATPNGQGGSTAQSVAVALSAPPPPVLILRSPQAANAGTLTPIDGLSVQDGAGELASTIITVTLGDSGALLALQNPHGGASVSGEDTTALTISGTAAQVNDDLAQVTFLYPSATTAPTLDTIDIRATADGATATNGVPVGNALTSTGAPDAPPPPLEYTGALPPDEQSTVDGLKVTDGDIDTYYFTVPVSGGIQFAIGLDDNDPTAVTVNDSLQPDTQDTGFQTEGGGPVSIAPLTVEYLLTAVDPDPQVGDQISYVVGGDDGDGYTLPDERIMLQVVSPATYAGLINNGAGGGGGTGNGDGTGNGNGGGGISGTGDGGDDGDGSDGDDNGDVHLQTFDGLYYNFQAAGEFVLAKSTSPGDTFQVQIRTQPYYNGAGASVTTEVAAAIGTDRVTFDLFRTATVWVDGSPVTPSANGLPMDLSGGTLSQLSATSWLLDYNTGQTVLVTEYPTFLNAQVGLPAGSAADVQGLLGTDSGTLANEFTLPNGTVLPQPLSYTDLYTSWANAWRVTQANSLLDYGAGQTTQSFTDLNFPTDSVPTSLFPAQVVAQAESLVAAAGITDPGAAQAAVQDYLLTGDTSFIAADATTAPTQAVAAEPTTPTPVSAVGIAADASVVVEAAAGPTPVVFSIYRTGDDSSAQVVEYAAQSADFPEDVLPTGQVTLAAGATLTMVTIDITGTLGSAPTAALSVTIDTVTTGVPVLAPTADVTISNNQPVPGTPAAPVFENASAVGTITQVGNAYTLNLGTFDLDALPPSLAVALVNNAAAPADTLSGNFTLSAADGIGVVSGSGPVTNLGAGRDITLQLAADMDSIGSFTQTITFDANEANASGFQAALGAITLTVTDTVAPPVSASVTPALVNFGTIHAGTTLDQAITIANTSSTPIAATTSTSGDATAAGHIATLAAGATNVSSILVGLGTDVDGKQSGTITLSIASPGGSGSATGLLLPPVSVTGSGAFSNAASLLADGVVPPVGTADSSADVVPWTDPAAVFTYDLGSVQTVAGVLASVDALGTYVVSASTDGTNFTPLFTITPEGTAAGLTTVASLAGSPYDDPLISFAPTQAQYLRLQAVGGDGTYAAGELDFFAAVPTVAVTGTIFNLASPAVIVPPNVILHVGDPGTLSLGVGNAAPADGYSENLIAALTSVSGGVTIASGGGTGDIAPGATDAGAFQLDFSTAQPGNINASATLAVKSDGAGIDGLGQTTLAANTVPINIAIDNYATAALQQLPGSDSFGTIGGSAPAQTLDIGTFEHNSGSLVIGLGVANTATGPADTLSGSIAATGAFTAAGFGAVPELGAGGADTAPTLTLGTASDGVFTETVTLTATDSNTAGYSAALAGQTLTVTGTIADLPPPVINVAPTLTVTAGVPMQIGPITVSDPNTITQALTVVLTDAVGLLNANASGAAAIGGAGTGRLTIVGGLTDINNVLAGVTYTDATAGTDTIDVTVTDEHRASSTTAIAVTTDPMPITAPVLNIPAVSVVVPGQQSGLGAISITDPSAEAAGQTVTVTIVSEGTTPQTFIASGGPGGTVTGQGTGTLTITGSLDEVNSYLSDGVTENILADAYQKALVDANEAGEKAKYFNFVFSLGVAGVTDGLAGVLEEETKLLEDTTAEKYGTPTPPNLAQALVSTTVGLYSFAANVLNDVAALAAGATSFPPAAGHSGGEGVHLVTYSGVTFQLDGAGEFLLTGSSDPNNSFTVEARLQPLGNSQSASVITQIAALVGTDRVTFGVGRDAVVYIDGTPTTVTAGTPITLTGGQLTIISNNTYQINWNTGEALTVTDEGSYLNINVGLGANDAAGSLVGLLGPDSGAANDFTLPGGSVLPQPLSSDQLTAYADLWLVTSGASLFDYAPGQTTTDFDQLGFPTVPVTLADLPASVVAMAAAAVAAAGITDPGAVAAAEFDYIVSGGDPAAITADQALFMGQGTTLATITPSAPPQAVLGVIAAQSEVAEALNGATAVGFQVYLTQAETADTVVNYAVVAASAGDLGAAAFGGILPTGTVTIAAGQTLGIFTIDVPQGALGSAVSDDVAVQITSPGTTTVFVPTALASISTPQPGAAPEPELLDLTKYGTFLQDGNDYTLDLGAIQYGQSLPTLQFGIENAAAAPADELGGTVSANTVEGFTVSGDTLPGPLGAGQSYTGITATINTIKFGDNSETITFDPTDTNASGYSVALAPITLTIADTLELPSLTYSQAYGDVHIITYNGLLYNFQAVGEFWLAQSQIPDDSFGIQLRLQPYGATSSVTVITEVAASLGADHVTFDVNRPDTVWVDGNPSTLSAADPVINLPGGTITEVSPDLFRVDWTTGETMSVTDAGAFFNVVDGIPPTDVAGGVAGLQGEAEGQQNDFQLPDGTVLSQPLTTDELYNVYGNAWRVSQDTSLFDYAPGQTTANFTDTSFPNDVLNLSDLPASVVAQAASAVAAAGISNPQIAQAAELDYIATDDMSFVAAAQNAQAAQTVPTTAPAVTESAPTPAVLVQAGPPSVVAAATGTTAVVFDITLTGTLSGDTPVDYTVVDGGAGFLGSAAFAGNLPSGEVTITAGQTIAAFTIDVPQGALGTAPDDDLQVRISTPDGNPIFTPTATAVVVNPVAEPGAPAIATLSDLTAATSLVAQGGTYVLDLGTLTQGQTVPIITLALGNAATAPADDLSGTFDVPLGVGFSVTGDSLPSALIPAAQYGGVKVTADTATIGTHSETLVFAALDVNDSGYRSALSPVTLILEDSVGAPAAAALNTPAEIVFPNARVGAVESHAISISNTAPPPAATLDVVAGATGAATVTGAIAGLPAGATDATDLTVGLNTASAGILSGQVQVEPISAAEGGTQPLPADSIDVFGDIYRPADPSVAPVNIYARVSDPGVTALSITNADPADGFSESLIAALTGASSGIGIGSAGPTGNIAAGDSDQSLTLTYSTAQAGVIHGTATLAATTDGGTGAGSIDGLGTLALAPIDVPVNITVDTLAQATFEYNGNPITGGTLDLGDLPGGLQQTIINLGVLNSAAGPADLLSGSYTLSGGGGAFGYTPGSFSELSAGAAFNTLQVLFNSAQSGTFMATITLSAESTLPSGADQVALPDQTLTLVADVLPCFLAGTRLATPGGPVAVEALAVGDRVRTADGGTRPVIWIGQRVVDCASHSDPASVLPVRIKRGAFGRGLPARDLLLSPDHAVYAEGVLIPVRHLIDGVRIVQRPARQAHYFHIELDRHDIVLAEGLAVESYLDVGDRARFTTIRAAPLVLADHAARTWDSDGCAPLCVTGPALDRVRARLRRQETGTIRPVAWRKARGSTPSIRVAARSRWGREAPDPKR
jgi:hypothetical protein